MEGKILALGVIGLVVLLAFTANFSVIQAAQNSTEINISVQVATKTMVDITPQEIVWTGIQPGEEANGSKTTTAGSVNRPGSIQIENVGSTNISYIWFNTTYPLTRPFGSGDNGSYDSANYVLISKYKENDFWWVNRVDYNESQELVYLYTPSGWWYGRIRNGSTEYFWAINATNFSACNQAVIRIGNTPHTLTQDGTRDFVNGPTASPPTDWTEYSLTAVDSYTGVTDVTIDGRDYCLAVTNCSMVMLYKWNKDAPGASTCTKDIYFWDKATDGYLHPGNSTIADLIIRVPYGVFQGYSKQGVLTAIVQSDDST